MTRLLAVLIVALSGCSSIVYKDGPQAYTPPEAWQDGIRKGDPLSSYVAPTVPLYRNDPAEQPRIVQVEYEQGIFLPVKVYANRCGPNGEGHFDPFTREAFLCGLPSNYHHEVEAHGAGMTHSAWEGEGRVRCAWIISPGYKTGYTAGERICITKDTRYEWAEK